VKGPGDELLSGSGLTADEDGGGEIGGAGDGAADILDGVADAEEAEIGRAGDREAKRCAMVITRPLARSGAERRRGRSRGAPSTSISKQASPLRSSKVLWVEATMRAGRRRLNRRWSMGRPLFEPGGKKVGSSRLSTAVSPSRRAVSGATAPMRLGFGCQAIVNAGTRGAFGADLPSGSSEPRVSVVLSSGSMEVLSWGWTRRGWRGSL
jgi:hypothetical protein